LSVKAARSQIGQERRYRDVRATSGLPPNIDRTADIEGCRLRAITNQNAQQQKTLLLPHQRDHQCSRPSQLLAEARSVIVLSGPS
jgi:hypothetical protein